MTYQPSKTELATLLRMVEVQASEVEKFAPDIARDELISEGQYALMMSMNLYDPDHGATAWTFSKKRVKGAMLNYIKKTRRPGQGKRNKDESFVFEDITDQHEALPDISLETMSIHFAVSKLTEKERSVVDRFLEDKTFSQISDELGISRYKIRGIWNGALEKVRTALVSRTDIY